jgi:hypothetical protein
LRSIAEQSVLILRLEDGQRRPRERLDIRDDACTVVAKLVAKLIAHLEATRAWNESRCTHMSGNKSGGEWINHSIL